MNSSIKYLLSLLLILQFLNCKKDEDTTVLVNATVANSSEGTVDFKSGDYAVGSSVTFTATPKTGYVFSSWNNTITNQTYTTNPLSITVNENTNLVANFEKAAYNIMFTISGEGSVQKEVVGGGGFTHGSQVKLTATPSENYSFFYWNNDPGDTENPKTITLEGDQNIPIKFDYQVARDLVGNWEFEIGGPASKNITIIKMSIDIFLNVLMTTIVNGEVISQIFTQMEAISTSAIVIGDFAVITDVVVASATSLSMKMVSIPEDTPPPTNESEISDTGTELNLSGNKSDEEPETDEDGIIIPPTDATTSSSTTEDIGTIFDESFDKLVNQAVQTATNTSTVEEGSFLDRVNGKMFASETNDYTAVFEFTNDIQGEFIKFHIIYNDCGETLINGSNIVAVTKNTENEFWFTFSINSENNSTAKAGQILAEARITFEDRPSGDSDNDANDTVFSFSILFQANEENSEFTKVIPSITSLTAGAVNGVRLIIDNPCKATIINGYEVSGVRLIEQNVCPSESVVPYELVFKKQGFGRFINSGEDALAGGGIPDTIGTFVGPRLIDVTVNFNDGARLIEEFGGTGINKYGIAYYCSNEVSEINSDQDNRECDIRATTFGGMNQLSYTYSGAVTDTTVSSIIHRIAHGNDEIRFITNIKSESECNSSTTDTTTATNTGTTSSTASGGGVNSGTTSSTAGGGNNTGTTTSTTTTNTTDTSTSTNTGTTTSTGGGGSNTGTTTSTTTTNTTDTSTSTNTGTTTSTGGGGSNTGTTTSTTTTNTTDTSTSTNTGTTSSTTTTNTTDSSCSLDVTLQSGSFDDQTVNEGVSMNEIVYDIVTDCTRVIHLVSSSGLPFGISASIVGNELKISGQPGAGESGSSSEGTNTGIFNYSITLDNHLEETATDPYVSATVSKVVNGTITVIDAKSYEINVTASNASDYTLSGSDRMGIVSGSDPNLTFSVGDTIDFVVDASGHPFYLKTVQGTGTNNLASGVSGNGSESGTVSFTPASTGTYYYQCSLHNGMYGTIIVQ